MEATVYILRCADGSYYTGLTKLPVEARVWEHNNDPIDGYAARRRPVQLVFAEIYERLTDAIARERQVKGWNRSKKEADPGRLFGAARFVIPSFEARVRFASLSHLRMRDDKATLRNQHSGRNEWRL
jgi:putative endonuclease